MQVFCVSVEFCLMVRIVALLKGCICIDPFEIITHLLFDSIFLMVNLNFKVPYWC